MSTYVLIHGAWHGAWCWHKIIPLLQADGHAVIAPDLPGHGADTTPRDRITLDAYVRAVTGILDQTDEPVILVGHSMGGIVITESAERRPGDIRSLVYLAAFLPRNGESLASMEQGNPYTTVPPLLVPSRDGRTATLREDKVTDLFYHDCSVTDIEYATIHLCPQALGLLSTPVQTSAENYGLVPRHYIRCSEDRALRVEFQDLMLAAMPDTDVHYLSSSHSPFFSMPEQLARILLRVSK